MGQTSDSPLGEHAALENHAIVIEKDTLANHSLSDTTRDVLEDDAHKAAAVGADLSRLPDATFNSMFETVLHQIQTAGETLPPEDRVYIIGLETDSSLTGEQIELASDDAVFYIEDAKLVSAYAVHDDSETIGFAHLTQSLDGVDYLLLATQKNGVLAGSDTTMDELRREVAMTQARRINLLGKPMQEHEKEAYNESFRYVFVGPLTAYEYIVGSAESADET
ncbi:hypothetical protein [Salinibaculum rarum]|uniref:hypothetical protein n=1 Tax=Salinibaculum rarum TaxID=3058903 RepID=UPI00265F8BC9|nr:hypothetical protein [Salinibaculum sp. KK48]